MLFVSRDDHGTLQAAIELRPVDRDGQLADADHAAAVWVEQLEISPGFRWRGWVRSVIREVARLCPHAGGAYWQRRDTTRQQVHWYARRQLLELAERGEAHATV